MTFNLTIYNIPVDKIINITDLYILKNNSRVLDTEVELETCMD